jgi:hypothetical protein
MLSLTFIYICLLFCLSCNSHLFNQNPSNSTSVANIPKMSRISGGNVYGPFGVTVFPRSGFGDRTGGTAIGWPAKGGYLTQSCSLVELEFLGLDRFQRTNMSLDPEKDEAHCAKWYRNPYQELLDETAEKDIDSPRLFVGLTADGGVWVIYTTLLGSRREGFGRIGNALTMEERCDKIKEFGGTFYEDPKDCPHLDLNGSRDGEGEQPEDFFECAEDWSSPARIHDQPYVAYTKFNITACSSLHSLYNYSILTPKCRGMSILSKSSTSS